MGNKFYLQLEASTGSLYEYSKTEKDGFEKHVYVGTDGVEKISYRRYHNAGIFGILKSVRRREVDMNGKKVLNMSVIMESQDGDTYYIGFPLKNGKGDIQDFAVAVLAYLPNLKEGNPYRFFPYAIEDKETKRKSYGVSIMHARLSDNAVDKTNKIPRLTYEVGDGNGGVKTPGDIPRLEWDVVMDKPTPNAKNRNEYLWNIFKEYEIVGSLSSNSVTTFNSMEENQVQSETATPAPAPTPKAEAPAPTPKKAAPAAETPAVADKPKTAMRPSESFEQEAKPAAAPAFEAADDDDDLDLPF
jgi:hypothetical protein